MRRDYLACNDVQVEPPTVSLYLLFFLDSPDPGDLLNDCCPTLSHPVICLLFFFDTPCCSDSDNELLSPLCELRATVVPCQTMAETDARKGLPY